ncbi:MAG: hypothetical protein Q9205_000490 [Flavoplaca limonia]
MAEAFAVIGLASALLQLLDFGGKVIKRLRVLEDQTTAGAACFRGVRTRFPLMLDLVKKIMLQMEAGLVSENSKAVMYPVVQNCLSQAQELDNLINKTLPQRSDNTWVRGKKAVYSVLSEPEIERVDAELKSSFELLIQAGTFQRLDPAEGLKSMTFAPSFTLSQLPLPQKQSQSTQSPWEELEKQTSTQSAILMVPFPRDANFLGRQDVLELISEKFEKTHAVTLFGLGGIGKSQIAIEYCYVFRDENPSAQIFWLYGADPLHFEQGYQDIARRARIPGWDDQKTDKLKLVQEWLQEENTTGWLMVVDNADDATMYFGTRQRDLSTNHDESKTFAQFLPLCSHGRILITTRDRRVGERLSQRLGNIEIARLSAGHSKDLLRSKISEEYWSEDDALKLVEYLSSLPLAIAQAAAFISENSVTISEYLETLVNDERDLKELLSEHLEDSRRDWSSENSVIRTWKLSFEQISKENPRAAEMLSLLSTLDYHAASRSLLRKDDETETGFRTALGVLQAFSLITASRGPNPVVKAHRLVAISIHKWLELRGTLDYWQSQALSILEERFPGPGQQHFREITNMLALKPHADIVLGYQFNTTDDMLKCARLLISTALFDLSSAKYQRSFESCERSLTIRESLLPSDHAEVLESVQTLGEALLHRGTFTGAKTLLQRAIVGREKSLGPLHVATLESLSDLTITLLELNELSAAESTGRKVLEGRQQVLGYDHPDYLVSLNIMAILSQMKGDYHDALEMTEKVLEERERLLGLECPDTLMTLNNFARLKFQMGDLDFALQMIDRVLVGEQQSLAGNGYDIQVSLSNKAAILIAQGRFLDAESVLRDVLKMRESALGPSHASTLFTMEALANVNEMRGGTDGATDLRQNVAKLSNGRQWLPEVGALLRAGLLFD